MKVTPPKPFSFWDAGPGYLPKILYTRIGTAELFQCSTDAAYDVVIDRVVLRFTAEELYACRWPNDMEAHVVARFRAAKNAATGKTAGAKTYVECRKCHSFSVGENGTCIYCGPEKLTQSDFVFSRTQFKCEVCNYVFPHSELAPKAPHLNPYCRFCDE